MKTLYIHGIVKNNAFFLEDVLKVEAVSKPSIGICVTLVRDGILTTVDLTRRGMSFNEQEKEFARLTKALSKINS